MIRFLLTRTGGKIDEISSPGKISIYTVLDGFLIIVTSSVQLKLISTDYGIISC